VLGSGEERAFRIAGYAAYYRHLKRSFLTSVESLDGAYPLEISHCGICVWSGACKERREADDHLSLVAGIRADQRAKLEDAGIVTMTQLAAARERPWRMTEGAFDNLRVQALLQVEQWRAIARGEEQPYRYRFREELRTQESAPQPPAAGFAKLPEPAPGDIFFDIEGDPLYRPDRGLEYLFGFYLPDEDRYVPFWAKDSGEERLAFEASVDFIAQRLARYPDLHVYHYASYEKSALRRLMGRFASREREIDNFLIRGLFRRSLSDRTASDVDLAAVIFAQKSRSVLRAQALHGNPWRRRFDRDVRSVARFRRPRTARRHRAVQRG